MMIRDFLNIDDDSAEVAAEASVRLCPSPKTTCDLAVTDVLPVGMTYAPMQAYRKLYAPEEGWRRGTVFCELDLPFRGGAAHD